MCDCVLCVQMCMGSCACINERGVYRWTTGILLCHVRLSDCICHWTRVMLVASKPSEHPVSVPHSTGVVDIGDHAQLLLCGFWELNSAKIDLHLLRLQAKYFIDCAFSPATHYSFLILNIPALLTNILIITVFKLCLLLTPTMMALRAVKKKKCQIGILPLSFSTMVKEKVGPGIWQEEVFFFFSLKV